MIERVGKIEDVPSRAQEEKTGPRLVEPEKGESGQTYSVPSRVVARELRVPLHDPPEPRPRSAPFDPDSSGPFRRFSPLKSWPEVRAIDAKLTQLDRQRAELAENVGGLERAVSDAKLADRAAVADWQLAGAMGEHPPASAEKLEAELEQARSDVQASTVAEDRLLREKVEFVEQHRKRLVRDAAKESSAAVKRLLDAIAAVEQAREQAITVLQAERWAREFPGPAANAASLRLEFMKGGRLSKRMADVRTLTVAASVIEWLRDDAAWLAAALADEQERELDPHEQSVWEDSEEGRQAVALANKRVAEGLKPRAVRQAEWFD
jgi:hypothetical protein